jgi:hypothetical protein
LFAIEKTSDELPFRHTTATQNCICLRHQSKGKNGLWKSTIKQYLKSWLVDRKEARQRAFSEGSTRRFASVL